MKDPCARWRAAVRENVALKNACDLLLSDIEALKSENARLRAALEVYADVKNWDCPLNKMGAICGEPTLAIRPELPWDIARKAISGEEEE